MATHDPDDDLNELAQGMIAVAQDAVRAERLRRQAAATRRRRAAQKAAGRVRVVGYVRVSTEDQGDSGAGLEAQRAAITAECRVRGWELLEICEDVASGSTLAKRPGLDAAMARIHAGEAATLVVAKLDRLSRSVMDAAGTIERARREGWNLVALDLGVDFSTAAGEAMAHMTAVFAQMERRLIGERTRAALAVRKAQGVKLGRPVVLPDAVRHRIVRARAHGLTLWVIADQLNRDGIATAHGGQRWYASTVRSALRSHSQATAGAQRRTSHPRGPIP